jgi:hypothetical protein
MAALPAIIWPEKPKAKEPEPRPQIFSREQRQGFEAWNVSGAKINLGGFGKGMLAQDIMLCEQANVDTGRIDVSLTFTRLITPQAVWKAFCEKFGDVTKSGSIRIDDYQVDNAVISQIGGTVAAKDMIVVEQVKMIGFAKTRFRDCQGRWNMDIRDKLAKE